MEFSWIYSMNILLLHIPWIYVPSYVFTKISGKRLGLRLEVRGGTMEQLAFWWQNYLWIFICILILLCAQKLFFWMLWRMIDIQGYQGQKCWFKYSLEVPTVAAKAKADLGWIRMLKPMFQHSYAKNQGLCLCLILLWLYKWSGKHILNHVINTCIDFQIEAHFH